MFKKEIYSKWGENKGCLKKRLIQNKVKIQDVLKSLIHFSRQISHFKTRKKKPCKFYRMSQSTMRDYRIGLEFEADRYAAC